MRTFESSVVFALLLAGSALAQTPPYLGELLIEPALNSSKCLTASTNKDGAAVTFSTCTGSAAQKWTFADGNVKVYGNKCLDVTGGRNDNGNKLQIWTCAPPGNANQQWYYDKWAKNLQWTNHGKCLDAPNGNVNDGTQLQIWQCSNPPNANQIWNTGYMANDLPQTSQAEQYGTNRCGTTSSQNSTCQTAWINSAQDFCLWAPPTLGEIGVTEREEVAYCTKSGRGTRLMPPGTLLGVHFVQTPDYVQVTGVGDFTKINIKKGDSGGELDNRGADGKGNPVGGLVYGGTSGASEQYHEWTNFMSDSEFCFRACKGPKASVYCNHIYDEMGCYWNMPANYDAGTFEDCDGDDGIPMGVYGTSTFHQGQTPTPSPHPEPSSSNCHSVPTVAVSPAHRRRSNGFEKRYGAAVAAPTAPPTSDSL